VIRMVGIAGFALLTAHAASAGTPACPPNGLSVNQHSYSTIVTIIPGCLSDPTDIGIAIAILTRQITDAHLQQNPNQSYVAVEEVLVESFVSEILEPSVPAPAN
jgi:hypothetical protein